MALCYELCGYGDESVDNQESLQQLERHDLFVTRAEILIRPLFRYCQYELKQAGKSTADEPLANGYVGATESFSDNNDAIVFRDRELHVDHKELRVLLLKIQSLEHEKRGKIESNEVNPEIKFLSSLSIVDDAIQLVQTLENRLSHATSSAGSALQAKLNHYALWRGYFMYTKTTKVMEHTENLLKADMNHAEKAHIYDLLLKHSSNLLTLPGTDDTEDEFILQVQANILRLRSLKTYHMGWAYFSKMHKHTPAMALLEHSAALCKSTQEELLACEDTMPNVDDYVNQMEQLDLRLSSAISAVRAATILQQRQHIRKLERAGAVKSDSIPEPIITDRPLLLRYYESDGGAVDSPIADIRPIPLPAKPSFYDIAYRCAHDKSSSVDTIRDKLYKWNAPISNYVREIDGDRNGDSSSIFGWLLGSKN